MVHSSEFTDHSKQPRCISTTFKELHNNRTTPFTAIVVLNNIFRYLVGKNAINANEWDTIKLFRKFGYSCILPFLPLTAVCSLETFSPSVVTPSWCGFLVCFRFRVYTAYIESALSNLRYNNTKTYINLR